MEELIVVGFNNTNCALQVLDELLAMHDDDCVVDLHGGVAAYWDNQGRPRFYQNYGSTPREEAGPSDICSLLIGDTLALGTTAGRANPSEKEWD